VDPAEFAHLHYQVEDGVALVTLNRPDRRNAWSGPMSVEYRWALHHAHQDADVRVVVLTGAGDTFCAGADTSALDQIAQRDGTYQKQAAPLPPYPDGTPDGLRHNHTMALAISVPVVAAINGACAGAGFVLATYADVRWAREGAKIATSFASLGLPAEYGIGWMLPRITGTANALELLYDPRPRLAEEARRLGFVQRILPAESLLPAAVAFARQLARHSSPASLRTMKRAVLVDAAGDLDSAYQRSVTDMDEALRSPDFRCGVAAARAKAVPDFLQPAGEGAATDGAATNGITG
jgi:enoyl-CoA hydratase/carnithine racemase